MRRFKVGDQVVVTITSTKPDYWVNGRIGKIVIDDKGSIPFGVEFENYDSKLHTLSGKVKDGHGWWFRADELKLTVETVPSMIGEIPVKPKTHLYHGKHYLQIDTAKPLMFSKTQNAFSDTAEPIQIIGILPSGQVMTENGIRFDPSYILCPAKYCPVKQMTQAEIEAKLGYKIKIVKAK